VSESKLFYGVGGTTTLEDIKDPPEAASADLSKLKLADVPF
jgi:hypothetical protein